MDEKRNNIGELDDKASTAITAVALNTQADALAHRAGRADVLPPIEQDAATRFLAGCTNARTQQAMRESLARIEGLLGTAPGSVAWARMRLPHTQDIRARLVRQYSKRTVNLTLAALRGVLRSAWELDQMSGDDYMRAISIKNLKVDRLPKGRALPAAEWAEVEAYARSLGPEGRDWPESAYGALLLALFSLLFGAGMRASEAAGLTVKGYDAKTRSVRFVGKGDKERVVPLGDAEHAALEAWASVRAELDLPPGAPFLVHVRPDGGLNPGAVALNRHKIERICKRTARDAGADKFSPHDLRRTFCTETLAAGVDVTTVQRFMGHASSDTTGLYDRRPAEMDAAARRKVMLIGRDIDVLAQRARVLAALAKR
jgi:integrase/recombinase XerD